jgi:uncharacterized protein (DUF1697 family)
MRDRAGQTARVVTASTWHVALLRGINVGGRNLIRMTDLAGGFEAAGFEGVRTYIQSGNVIFRAPPAERAVLVGEVEAMLSERFAYEARVEVRDHHEMRAVVTEAPPRFGQEPDRFRYDVLFLMPPLTPAAALDALTLKDGIDTAAAGPGAVYTTRLIERATQSGISRIASHPIYARLTIRNWNTTSRLLALMDEAADAQAVR